jgi:hypothetical protein
VKADKRTTNGVIWHDGIVKADKKTANGVIWHDGIENADDKTANGVIWHSVTEVNYAQTAASDSGVNRASPQMNLIKKWAVKNIANASIEPSNIIKLESSKE